MGMNIQITDFVNTREVETGISLSWVEGLEMNLETLIKERVRLEVEKSGANAVQGLPHEHPLFAIQQEAECERDRERRIKTAQKAAISSFLQNDYFVVVDGNQIDDLETQFSLQPNSKVRFVRLLQLIGG